MKRGFQRTRRWSTLHGELEHVKNNNENFHSLNKMGAVRPWLNLCVLAALVMPFRCANNCMDGIDLNVILLDDENSPWGLQHVRGEVLKAIEEDKLIGEKEGSGALSPPVY